MTGPVVLLVDDDPLKLRTAILGMRHWGAHVVAVRSVSDALRVLQSERVDAVLTDWNVPVAKGGNPTPGGRLVLAAAPEAMPLLIWSGDDQPATLTLRERARWTSGRDLRHAIRWLMSEATGAN